MSSTNKQKEEQHLANGCLTMGSSKVRRVSKKKNSPGKYKKPLRNLKFEVVSPINEWCYEGMPPWRKSGNVSIKEETYCTRGISGQWPLHQ